MAVAGISGFLTGSSLAIFQGLPILSTTFSITTSCAMTCIACILPQRLAHNVLPKSSSLLPMKIQQVLSVQNKENQDSEHMVETKKCNFESSTQNEYLSFQDGSLKESEQDHRFRIILSHFIGGMIGGSINGALFIKRPAKGMLLFTPIMLGVSWVELELEGYRKRETHRIKKELIEENCQ